MWSLWLLLAAIALLLMRLVSQGKKRQKEERVTKEQAQAKEAEALADSKTCPKCAESIKKAARVCRFCGHPFPESDFIVPTASRTLAEIVAHLSHEPSTTALTVGADILADLRLLLPEHGIVLQQGEDGASLQYRMGPPIPIRSDHALLERLQPLAGQA